jgi:hypothetical protein
MAVKFNIVVPSRLVYKKCSRPVILKGCGVQQDVVRCAANMMTVYFKNEKKLICTEIFIRFKFLILYMKHDRILFTCFTVHREPRTSENPYWI